MPVTEMIVLIAVFTAMLLGFINVVRLIALLISHRTVRLALDRDPDSAEKLLGRLETPAPGGSGDDRTATILVAVGIAMIGGSLIVGDPNWLHYGVAAALFPLAVGTALWLRLWYLARMARRDAGQ